MKREDALSLANEMDAAWHDQARSFEREAVTRFWGLLTLPARALDPALPRAQLRAATVLRNVWLTGAPVKEMFYGPQDTTEVDALFFRVGSALGHTKGDDAWVVEVERKKANQHSDYYKSAARARKVATFVSNRFRVPVRPVLIYDDEDGKFLYPQFEDDLLSLSMSLLRARTRGLSFPALDDLPGLSCDKSLMKLALMRQLVKVNPDELGWYRGPLSLAHDAASDERGLHLPVVGYQDAGMLPHTLETWLSKGRESDDHLETRIEKYLDELFENGMLDGRKPHPRLSVKGGQVVLRLLRSERENGP